MSDFLTIKDTVSVLEAHRNWRLGLLEEMPMSPRALTVAIDSALYHLSKVDK